MAELARMRNVVTRSLRMRVVPRPGAVISESMGIPDDKFRCDRRLHSNRGMNYNRNLPERALNHTYILRLWSKNY